MFDFPSAPVLDQVFAQPGVVYRWNGYAWDRDNAAGTPSDAVYPTYASIAASIVGATKIIRTETYAVPGDNGGATWNRMTVEPTHAGKARSADAVWFELDRNQVLSPTMVGAKFDGVSNDTAFHKSFATVLNAFKGGTVRYPRNKVSIVWPTSPVPNQDILYHLVGIRGLLFDFNGSALRCPATAWGDVSYGFLTQDCENMTFFGPRYEQPNLNSVTLLSQQGILRGCRFIITTDHMKHLTVFGIYQTGGIGGVEHNRNFGTPLRSSGITILGGEISDVIYPFSYQKNGDNVFIRGVTLRRPARGYLGYNVSNHDIELKIFELGVIMACVNVSVGIDGTEFYTLNQTRNIKLKVDFPASFSGILGGSSHGSLLYQQNKSTPGAGYIEDVDIQFTIDQSQVPSTGVVFFFNKQGFGSSIDTVGRGHYLTNFRLSGSWAMNTAYMNGIWFFNQGENCYGDHFQNIRFEDLHIRGMLGGMPSALIHGPGVDSMIWDVKCDGRVEFHNFADNVLQYNPASTRGVSTSAPTTHHTYVMSGTYRRIATGAVLDPTQVMFVVPVKNLSKGPAVLALEPNDPALLAVTNRYGSPIHCSEVYLLEGDQGPADMATIFARIPPGHGLEPGHSSQLLLGLYGNGRMRIGTVGTPSSSAGPFPQFAVGDEIPPGFEATGKFLEELRERFPPHQREVPGPTEMGGFKVGDIVEIKNSLEGPLTIMGFDENGAILNVAWFRKGIPLDNLVPAE